MMLLYYAVILMRLLQKAHGDIGYSYPAPQPPILFDEPSTPPPAPIYLPPPLNDVPQPPGQTYLPPSVQYPPLGYPPLNDEILPPYVDDDSVLISSPPSNAYLPPTSASSRSPLQLFNMSCLDAKDGSGFFRTLIRSNSALNRGIPMIEKAGVSDCLVVPLSGDLFRIDFEGQRMIECGVKNCGGRMCLNLRMAGIPGLRLADDALITLQCVPQEAVVAHTKHLKLNTNTEVQGRANLRAISVASGGVQRPFETEMALLRKHGDTFDQQIVAGGAVRLGDELLLRTTVKDGNGWKYSKLGTVQIRSTATQKSVLLIDENGCRIPGMQSVCPQNPQQIAPLTVQLPFRAFLFQGSTPADDLLLSVRMIGCIRARDCYQSRICDENKSRTIRALNFGNGSEIVTENELQFRVLPMLPEERLQLGSFGRFSVVLVFFGILLCFLVLVLVKICKK